MKKTKNSIKIFAAIIISLSFIITAGAVDELVAIGHTAGIRLSSNGAIVIGFSDTQSENPAKKAGICEGDIIQKVNDAKISSNSDLVNVVTKSDGNPLIFEYIRNGEKHTCKVTPCKNENDKLVVGIWVRDSLSGIGTLTYYNPETDSFGALGHGISDGDTNILIPINDGSLLPSTVRDVKRGRAGQPGELIGNYDTSKSFASIEKNTDGGIFGKILDKTEIDLKNAYPVAEKKDIHRGEATILSNIEGDEVKEYKIEITGIYFDGEKTKNMLIRATDSDLISKTGGIVRGMSGSPIIQNGKLVGAVTHVLVNDPTKGYGIFIENMLSEAEKIK